MYNCKINGWISLADVRHLDPEVELDFGEEKVPGIPYPVGKITAGKLLEDYDWAARLEEWQFEALSEYNEYHCTEILTWAEVDNQYVGRFDSPSCFVREYIVMKYGPAAVRLYDDYQGTLEARVMESAYEEYDILYHNHCATYVFLPCDI